MSFTDPGTIRTLFNTTAARECFDRLYGLGAMRWLASREDNGFVFLAPHDIHTQSPNSCGLMAIGTGYGASFDDIIQNTEKTLIRRAMAEGAVVVVNGDSTARKEYGYDAAAQAFIPRRPR